MWIDLGLSEWIQSHCESPVPCYSNWFNGLHRYFVVLFFFLLNFNVFCRLFAFYKFTWCSCTIWLPWLPSLGTQNANCHPFVTTPPEGNFPFRAEKHASATLHSSTSKVPYLCTCPRTQKYSMLPYDMFLVKCYPSDIIFFYSLPIYINKYHFY